MKMSLAQLPPGAGMRPERALRSNSLFTGLAASTKEFIPWNTCMLNVGTGRIIILNGNVRSRCAGNGHVAQSAVDPETILICSHSDP